MGSTIAGVLLFALLAQGAPPAPPPNQTSDDCGCEVEQLSYVAVVNGTKIDAAELEAAAAQPLAQLRGAFDRVRASALELVVLDRLVDREAKRRHLSRNELIRAEVIAASPDPTDEEIRAYYLQTNGSAEGPLDQLRPSIARMLHDQAEERAYSNFIRKLRAEGDVKILEPAPHAPASLEERAKTVATVYGTPISLGEVEDRAAPQIADIRHEVYEVKRATLERVVNDMLVAARAKARGITPDAYIDSELAARAHPVGHAEAAAYYEAHKSELDGARLEDVEPRIVAFLGRQQQIRAINEMVADLRREATIQVLLVEPAPFAFPVDVADRPTRGPASAAVTIVEFTDFECPRCAQASQTVEELVGTYGDRVRVVVRNFPLEKHPFAFRAAEEASAAAAQGKYWQYAALLFANQADLGEAKLRELASRAGLDGAKFDAALASHEFAPAVERDQADGRRLGISGTPAFFVNGRPVEEVTDKALKLAVADAIERSAATTSK